jgi:hypothetical protein
MTMQATHVESRHRESRPRESRNRIYDVQFPSLDAWDTPDPTTIDLGRFARLTEDERRRIIIRVLCGLVAMEEPAEEPERRPHANPTPGQAPALPFLGLETPRHKCRTKPRTWSTALLPHLGPERPF